MRTQDAREMEREAGVKQCGDSDRGRAFARSPTRSRALDGVAGYDESATINYRGRAAGYPDDARLIPDSGVDAILITGD